MEKTQPLYYLFTGAIFQLIIQMSSNIIKMTYNFPLQLITLKLTTDTNLKAEILLKCAKYNPNLNNCADYTQLQISLVIFRRIFLLIRMNIYYKKYYFIYSTPKKQNSFAQTREWSTVLTCVNIFKEKDHQIKIAAP